MILTTALWLHHRQVMVPLLVSFVLILQLVLAVEQNTWYTLLLSNKQSVAGRVVTT